MISVCMATYNGGRYLREQVDSILSQLSQDDELIVSDDGSTDNSIQILKGYNDSRIKIFPNSDRHGVNANFENALRHASGDYIFLSDQDDVWLPGKVNACVKALQENICVEHDCIIVDENLNVIQPSFFSWIGAKTGFWKNLARNSYHGCCLAFRREILDEILPIPENLIVYHDEWIGSLCDLKGGFALIPFKGILFRRYENTTSVSGKKSTFSFRKKIQFRANLLNLVMKRHFLLKRCNS